MSGIKVPTSQQEWFTALNNYDPADVGISGFGANALGSASRLDYQDWLLLKIVWAPYPHQPTHVEFFGEKAPSRSAEALAALSKEDWWKPLIEGDKKPWNWKQLAAWKQNANDIIMRKPFHLDPAGVMFDPTDPFRFDVQPPTEPAGRPQRHQSDRHGQEKAEREAQLRRLDQYVYDQSPNQSPSPSDAGRKVSPTGSERLGSSSGSPGSTGRAQPSTASFHGGSSEGKFINSHRPDEAIINMSMVLLLQGVCMSLLQTQEYELYDWTILHKLFTISQPDPDDQKMRRKILTAKTDGCLQARHKGQDPDKGDALVILEAKPYRRDAPARNTAAIRIQEGAEMAAWISTEARKGLLPSRSDDKTIYRRLLVSQDFDQVFLTIAEFDDRYIQYITGNDEGWLGAGPTLDPLATPSRDARVRVEQRSGMRSSPSRTGDSRLPLQESRGRKKDESKDTKPSVSSAFRSSSSSKSASSLAPAPLADPASLPVRSRGNTPPGSGHPSVPITPVKSSARPLEAPPAPRQSAHPAANIEEGTQGFLRMREYLPFKINDPAHVQELLLLVYSLTKYLVEHEDRGRFRPKP